MAVPRDNSKFLRNLPMVRFNEEPRGYSKAEVDRVLENIAPIADSIEELQDKLRSAEDRAVQAEGRVASAESRLVEAEAEAARQTMAAAEMKDAATKESVVSPAFAEPIIQAPVVAPAVAEPAIDHEYDEILRKTLILAQRTADTTVKEANEEASSLLSSAQSEADIVLGSARDEADTILASSRAERDAFAESIKEERGQRLDEVEAEIVARRDELAAALEANEASERDRLVQEVSDLIQIRDLLVSDIDLFEEHLVARREVLRAALGSLNDLVDNADDLESVEAPAPSDTPVFDPEEYEAIELGLPDNLGRSTDADEPKAPTADGFLFGEVPRSGDQDGVTGDAFDGTETQMYEVVITDDDGSSDHDSSDGYLDAGDVESSDSSGELDAFAAFAESDVPVPGADDAIDQDLIVATVDDSGDGSARPAWADAVPPETATPQPLEASGASDPFLDELRRATEGDDAGTHEGGSPDAEAEALSRFLDSDDDSGRTGWFGRRK